MFGMSYNCESQMKATPREGVNGQGESGEKMMKCMRDIFISEKKRSVRRLEFKSVPF